ncbi:MarR family winged helix-turn-helix transcriptional regulator [Marinivivus vitaminiproducens]|uniref:MarR family winged helix-turn-helix transcriptional regulator n=1 Tax=Marinivivus vitaminiproducens TaxID=3035935 RepID=UPI00279A8778|nr:MarR family winged helix-turn-helix transcriptional regulator [Geminicoccaceae bacterium SCSIO 64248]
MTTTASGLCNCTALRQGTRHVSRLYDEALAPVGLGVNQYAILVRLGRVGPKSIQDLAQLLVMDRSTLGRLVRPLERRRLVRLDVPSADRRARLVVLTDEGRALVERAQPHWRRAQAIFEHRLGSEAALSLRELLMRVTSIDFQQKPADPAGGGGEETT